jgi:FkbM family methyltransferase
MLPFRSSPAVFVDLGANIGLTSLWIHSKYGCERIIAIEPDKGNAQVARENFALNDVPGEVIEAAIGPRDGIARFACNSLSNLGKVVCTTQPAAAHATVDIQMISMATVLEKLSDDSCIDLLKIDIEGGEQELFQENSCKWLAKVNAIIIEFHPGLVDCDTLVRHLEQRGFDHIPPNSVFPGNVEAFVRR